MCHVITNKDMTNIIMLILHMAYVELVHMVAHDWTTWQLNI